MKKHYILFLCFVIPAIFADVLPAYNFSSYYSRVIDNSSSLNNASLAVQTAMEKLGYLSLDNSRMTINSSYIHRLDDSAGRDSLGLSSSLSVSIPIVPQLSLSGRLQDDLTGSVSLTLNPFAANPSNAATLEQYEKAVINYLYLHEELLFSFDTVFFRLIESDKILQIAERSYTVALEEEGIARALYSQGSLAYEDFILKQQNSITKRRDYFNAMNAQAEAQRRYLQSIGLNADQLKTAEIKLESFSELLEQRNAFISQIDSGILLNRSYEMAKIELKTLGAKLKETWVYTPDMALSASLDFPLSKTSASISITFSPKQFQSAEKTNLYQEVLFKEQELEQILYSLRVEDQINKSMLEIANDAWRMSLTYLEQQRILTEETDFFFAIGERTSIELEKQKVRYLQAQLNALSSAIDVYQAQSNYIRLYR